MVAKYRFRASDAFTYVDTYRREILANADRIQDDLKRIQEEVWSASEAPSRVYAQLRAVEHALEFVVRREEPGLVVLGETSGADEDESDSDSGESAEVTELKQALDKREAEVVTLQASLKHTKEKAADLEAEVVARDQQNRRLQHRLDSSQSTITVLSGTAVLLTLGLFYLLLA